MIGIMQIWLLQYFKFILTIHFISIMLYIYNLYTQVFLPYFLCFFKIITFLIYLFTNHISDKCVLMLIRDVFIHFFLLPTCKEQISGPQNYVICKKLLIIFTTFAQSCLFILNHSELLIYPQSTIHHIRCKDH